MIMIIVLTMICCLAVAYLLDHLEDLNSQRSEPIELLRLIWRDKGVEGVNKSINKGDYNAK
tara:strand:- start:140 stop:322 length:183 start_codon:yes stop_codon:yes gene_type:complete